MNKNKLNMFFILKYFTLHWTLSTQLRVGYSNYVDKLVKKSYYGVKKKNRKNWHVVCGTTHFGNLCFKHTYSSTCEIGHHRYYSSRHSETRRTSLAALPTTSNGCTMEVGGGSTRSTAAHMCPPYAFARTRDNRPIAVRDLSASPRTCCRLYVKQIIAATAAADVTTDRWMPPSSGEPCVHKTDG